jgi:hypothetical protein
LFTPANYLIGTVEKVFHIHPEIIQLCPKNGAICSFRQCLISHPEPFESWKVRSIVSPERKLTSKFTLLSRAILIFSLYRKL